MSGGARRSRRGTREVESRFRVQLGSPGARPAGVLRPRTPGSRPGPRRFHPRGARRLGRQGYRASGQASAGRLATPPARGRKLDAATSPAGPAGSLGPRRALGRPALPGLGSRSLGQRTAALGSRRGSRRPAPADWASDTVAPPWTGRDDRPQSHSTPARRTLRTLRTPRGEAGEKDIFWGRRRQDSLRRETTPGPRAPAGSLEPVRAWPLGERLRRRPAPPPTPAHLALAREPEGTHWTPPPATAGPGASGPS